MQSKFMCGVIRRNIRTPLGIDLRFYFSFRKTLVEFWEAKSMSAPPPYCQA
jgi:hypothetical protein